MIGGSAELFSLEKIDYPDLEVKRFNKNLPLFGFALDLEFECECDMNCWQKDSPFTDTLVDIQAFLKHSTSNYSEMEKDSTDLERFFLSQDQLFKYRPRVFTKDSNGTETEVDDYFKSSFYKIVSEYNNRDSELERSSFDKKIYFFFDSRNFFPHSDFDAVGVILKFKQKTIYISSCDDVESTLYQRQAEIIQ